MSLNKLIVKTKNNHYPIIIGNNLISKISQILKNNKINYNKCLLVVDKKVPKYLLKKITTSLSKKKTLIHLFHANELQKNQANVNKILNILNLNLPLSEPYNISLHFVVKNI